MGFLDRLGGEIFGTGGRGPEADEGLLGATAQQRNVTIDDILRGFRGFLGATGGTLAPQATDFIQNILGRSQAAGISAAIPELKGVAEEFFPTAQSLQDLVMQTLEGGIGGDFTNLAAQGFQGLLDFSPQQTVQEIISGITGPTVGALSESFFGPGGAEEQLSARLAQFGTTRGGQAQSQLGQAFAQGVLQPATLQAAQLAGQIGLGQSGQLLQALGLGGAGMASLAGQQQQGILGAAQQDIQNRLQTGGLQAQLLTPNDLAQQQFFQGLASLGPTAAPITQEQATPSIFPDLIRTGTTLGLGSAFGLFGGGNPTPSTGAPFNPTLPNISLASQLGPTPGFLGF